VNGSVEWTREQIAAGEVHCHRVKRRVYGGQNRHQGVEIVETEAYGLGLLLDGRLQHLEGDEYIYSEGIVHPFATLLQDRCKRVLVIGGGPGGAIREVLKHRAVVSVTQVEIDESIVDLTREYFTHIAQGYQQDPRVEIVIADIHDYLRTCTESFDLVINDVNEPLPDSPSREVFSRDLMTAVRERLSPEGVYVTWAGSAGPFSSALAVSITQRLRGVFPYVTNYVSFPQSYGTVWLTAVASKHAYDPLERSPAEIDALIAANVTGALRLYDGITHHHMFLLPKDIRALVQPGTNDGDAESRIVLAVEDHR
jgi:spermidine synthase